MVKLHVLGLAMNKEPFDIDEQEIDTEIPEIDDLVDDEIYYETDLNDAIREIEGSIYHEQKDPEEE